MSFLHGKKVLTYIHSLICYTKNQQTSVCTTIREKTLMAVVDQMFPPFLQINVGRRDVFSHQAYGPNIEW